MTAEDVAAGLGMHRSVARARLEKLLRAGLLAASFARRSGRSGPGAGRPAKLYAAAPELEALEFPPRHLASLVARLLDELPVAGREESLRHAGEEFGRELAEIARLQPAADTAAGVEGVCAAVRALGFHASLARVDGDRVVIDAPICPLRPLVTRRPEAAHIDRGMWAGLIERGLRGAHAAGVECETHACLEGAASCSVIVRLRR